MLANTKTFLLPICKMTSALFPSLFSDSKLLSILFLNLTNSIIKKQSSSPQTPTDSKLQKLRIRFYQTCTSDRKEIILTFFLILIKTFSAKRSANICNTMNEESLTGLLLQSACCTATAKGSFPLSAEFSTNPSFY